MTEVSKDNIQITFEAEVSKKITSASGAFEKTTSKSKTTKSTNSKKALKKILTDSDIADISKITNISSSGQSGNNITIGKSRSALDLVSEKTNSSSSSSSNFVSIDDIKPLNQRQFKLCTEKGNDYATIYYGDSINKMFIAPNGTKINLNDLNSVVGSGNRRIRKCFETMVPKKIDTSYDIYYIFEVRGNGSLESIFACWINLNKNSKDGKYYNLIYVNPICRDEDMMKKIYDKANSFDEPCIIYFENPVFIKKPRRIINDVHSTYYAKWYHAYKNSRLINANGNNKVWTVISSDCAPLSLRDTLQGKLKSKGLVALSEMHDKNSRKVFFISFCRNITQIATYPSDFDWDTVSTKFSTISFGCTFKTMLEYFNKIIKYHSNNLKCSDDNDSRSSIGKFNNDLPGKKVFLDFFEKNIKILTCESAKTQHKSIFCHSSELPENIYKSHEKKYCEWLKTCLFSFFEDDDKTILEQHNSSLSLASPSYISNDERFSRSSILKSPKFESNESTNLYSVASPAYIPKTPSPRSYDVNNNNNNNNGVHGSMLSTVNQSRINDIKSSLNDSDDYINKNPSYSHDNDDEYDPSRPSYYSKPYSPENTSYSPSSNANRRSNFNDVEQNNNNNNSNSIYSNPSYPPTSPYHNNNNNRELISYDSDGTEWVSYSHDERDCNRGIVNSQILNNMNSTRDNNTNFNKNNYNNPGNFNNSSSSSNSSSSNNHDNYNNSNRRRSNNSRKSSSRRRGRNVDSRRSSNNKKRKSSRSSNSSSKKQKLREEIRKLIKK